MKKRLLKIIGISLIILIQYFSISYAAVGAKAKSNSTEVEQGSTFDVYVTLDVASEAYDIKFDINDSSLISKSEVVPTVEGNKLSGNNRIYLVQIDSAENRIKHPVGTKIACMRYTVSDKATVGSTISITVTGDIVGENNSENSINDIIKVKVKEKTTEKNDNSTYNNVTKDDSNKKDNTIANKDLSDAGLKALSFGIIAFIIILFVFFKIKYKKYKDIK